MRYSTVRRPLAALEIGQALHVAERRGREERGLQEAPAVQRRQFVARQRGEALAVDDLHVGHAVDFGFAHAHFEIDGPQQAGAVESSDHRIEQVMADVDRLKHPGHVQQER